MERLDQLETVLKMLFCHYPLQRIFERFDDDEYWNAFVGATEEEYVQLAYTNNIGKSQDSFSKEDLKNQFRYYCKQMHFDFQKWGYGEHSQDCLNPIECLFYYVARMLTIDNNEVVCHYKRIVNWQKLTLEVSGDLLVSAYIAMHKTPGEISETDLSWKLVLDHDNHQLKRILNRGLAENHFHLYGSAPVFHLSWISLMNHVIGSRAAASLARYDRNRMNPNLEYDNTIFEMSLRNQHLLAACIRLILFMALNPDFSFLKMIDPTYYSFGTKTERQEGMSVQERINLHLSVDASRNTEREHNKTAEVNAYNLISMIRVAIANKEDRIYELEDQLGNLQDTIDLFRDWYDFSLPDYALLGSPGRYDEYNGIFHGERWLLYQCFYRIRTNCFSAIYTSLFYAYVLIKEKFRHELIKFDDKVGFSHFQDFDRRKFDLLEERIFHGSLGAAARAATREHLLKDNMLSLEVRVTPDTTVEGNLKLIRNLDYIIGDQTNRYFYTFHFLKRRDDWKRTDADAFYCRHYMLRRTLQKQTHAIMKLREHCPKTAARVLGIDAASQEIGCRPEVFGFYFRYLHCHTHSVEDESGIHMLPQLRRTYHVGEDFLDIVDGLRAIDEAVRFLGMESGDRIGHALALGINVKEWYAVKNNVITLPKQDYLDNVAWLYHMLLKYRPSDTETLQEYLKREFSIIFRELYSKNMSRESIEWIIEQFQGDSEIASEYKRHTSRQLDFDIFQYYSAWKLRSDDPTLYESGYYQGPILDTEFERCRVNSEITRGFEVRYLPEVFLIHYFYQYSMAVRNDGEVPIQKEVTEAYIDGVVKVQKALQADIGRRGLAIETNPTSNLLIGTFEEYYNHPITNFYNMELEVNDELLAQNPQLLVSINTDDQGIFSTSLDNEYAVIACALENSKDKAGRYRYPKQRVYAWLDSIRKMGLDQSFNDISTQNTP